MKSFQLLVHILLAVELAAFLITLYYFIWKDRSNVSLLLLIFVTIVACTESMGALRQTLNQYFNVFLVQKIEIFFEITMYLAIYYLLIVERLLKKIVISYTLLFWIISVISCIYWQPIVDEVPTKAVALGGILVLTSVLLYFYDSFRNKPDFNFFNDRMFYFSIGLFIFFANEIPAMVMMNYYSKIQHYSSGFFFTFGMKLIGAIIFYLLFSFGMLWTIRK